jgi:hypothetical protein
LEEEAACRIVAPFLKVYDKVPPPVLEGEAVNVTFVPELTEPAASDVSKSEGDCLAFTVKLFVSEVVPHEPPLVVNVSVTGLAELEAAV